MIGSLRGRMLDRSLSGEVLVETGGVGYRVTAGPATVARLGDLDSEVFVWTYHHIREDSQVLYGFATKVERETFEALLGAHGVGPALALAILTVHPPDALARVVAGDDIAGLCLVPGVGKKTAARLLIELKSRLDDVPTAAATSAEDGPDGGEGGSGGSVLADVRDGLTGLGYGPEEVAQATRDLEGTDAGAMLKEALKKLAGSR
ncbi:MAG: Holliday junction branch migration protein RuvA [Acidimicrobiales bacterium]|nr:Holliday junction branch migration protein RuvA [Acidimicrobiales bacterium]